MCLLICICIYIYIERERYTYRYNVTGMQHTPPLDRLSEPVADPRTENPRIRHVGLPFVLYYDILYVTYYITVRHGSNKSGSPIFVRHVRPISLLTLWVSEGLTQA